MMLQRKKEGVVRGCIVPILALIGFIAVCYLFCFALYALNVPFISGPGSSTGGMIFLPFH